jgi:hypothetical protein
VRESEIQCERAPYDKESWYCLTHNRLEMKEEVSA